MNLGQGVGGHDAVSGSDPVVGAQMLDRGRQASLDAIDWQRLKDHAGGKRQHLLAVDLHERGQRIAGLLSSDQAGLSRARIGVASVDDKCANGTAAGEVFFAESDRSRAKTVGGEDACHRRAGRQPKDGQVAAICLADARFGDTDLHAWDGEHLIIFWDLQINGHDRLVVGQSKKVTHHYRLFEPVRHGRRWRSGISPF